MNRYEVIKDVDHGDTKTNLAFPHRRPTLKVGDIVTRTGELNNWYGNFIRVKSDRSTWEYDVPPCCLREVKADA